MTKFFKKKHIGQPTLTCEPHNHGHIIGITP
jgi:hypothetical protein